MIHTFQKIIDALWMITYIAGGLASAYEVSQVTDLSMRVIFLATSVLLLSLGFSGKSYPDVEPEELKLPE